MEAGLREVCRSVRIGKILIQRVRRFPSSFISTYPSTPYTGRRNRSTETILCQGVYINFRCICHLPLGANCCTVPSRYCIAICPVTWPYVRCEGFWYIANCVPIMIQPLVVPPWRLLKSFLPKASQKTESYSLTSYSPLTWDPWVRSDVILVTH